MLGAFGMLSIVVSADVLLLPLPMSARMRRDALRHGLTVFLLLSSVLLLPLPALLGRGAVLCSDAGRLEQSAATKRDPLLDVHFTIGRAGRHAWRLGCLPFDDDVVMRVSH